MVKNMNYVDFSKGKIEPCSLLIEHGVIRQKATGYPNWSEKIETIDLRGKYAIPGFIDAHTHLISEGITMQRLDLGKCRSLDECLGKISTDIKEKEVVFASKWDETSWHADDSDRLTRRTLDRISSKKPIIMRRVCGHYAVVNTAALRCIPRHRKIVDRQQGRLFEDAALNLNDFFPPSGEMLEKAVLLAGDMALRQGITSVHEISKPAYFRVLQKKRRDLKIRYAVYLTEKYCECVLKTGLTSGYGDDWLKFAGIKVFLDGSIGARTAALRYPYPGTRRRGILLVPAGRLKHIVKMTEEAGIQLMLHSIGDRSTQAALRVLEKHTASRNPLRHRFEHLEILNDELVADIGRMKIVASMQPNFVHCWQNPGGLYHKVLGSRYVGMNRFKSLLDRGVRVAFGSDCMPLGPLYGVRGAIHHPSLCERLSAAEAFGLYTNGGAFATFEEKRKGRLEPGCFADIAVLNENPLEEKNLGRLKILTVIVGGTLVYNGNAELPKPT